MEAIKLDILPGAMPPIVHVSQGDIGRQFKISIYDETGAAYSLTGKTLSIVGHKQDGNVFQYAIASSAISGNEVTITTEEQMTPVAGKTLCEITIEQGTTKLGTANFVMQVEQGPADMGLMSTSALYVIQALFNEATEDIETAQAAAATATQKAAEAAASVAQIGDSVQVATQKAAEAASSASSAATSASQAAAAVEGVHDDAVAAQNAATAAATSASAASTSASAAATSATNASNYASAADTSADNASDYADAASQSASAAALSATNASGSASDASTAATNAANSAAAAAGSASDASTYANNAAGSATAAAGSASDASTYAGNASTSATNAANSASAAATSASEAEDAKDAIEDMTVSSQTVPYTSPAEVTKTIVQGVVNLDFKIPRGEPMSGHEVIANPSGAATGGDLTKLGIDGTNYNVSGLPDSSQASNGDVLTKTASGPAWAAPTKELPAIASGDAGKVLVVNSGETGVEWATPSGGGGKYVKGVLKLSNDGVWNARSIIYKIQAYGQQHTSGGWTPDWDHYGEYIVNATYDTSDTSQWANVVIPDLAVASGYDAARWKIGSVYMEYVFDPTTNILSYDDWVTVLGDIEHIAMFPDHMSDLPSFFYLNLDFSSLPIYYWDVMLSNMYVYTDSAGTHVQITFTPYRDIYVQNNNNNLCVKQPSSYWTITPIVQT